MVLARITLFVLVLLATDNANASVVQRLDQVALESGADLIVEGEVAHVITRWNPRHTGLETVVRIAISRTLKGDATALVDIVQPGGNLDGAQHVIVGMPNFEVGDQARYYLQRTGVGTHRVYGWQQGVWRASDAKAIHSYDPPSLPHANDDANLVHFTHNGMLWKPEQIPVSYRINAAGSDDLNIADSQAAIHVSFQTWQDVACSALSFQYDGETDLQLAVDSTNVVTWIEADWIYGEEAAAATSLFFAPQATPTADIAFNGVSFTWANAPLQAGTGIQDVQGVLTHELGHFSGLSHTQSSLDTMYFSWTPWQSQRSLSADDKLGLCELYPQNGDECLPGECPNEAICETYERGTLCSPQADPIGAPCNYDRVECEAFCLFTSTTLSTGYCSEFCDSDSDCPDRFACKDASAGGSAVRVCFSDDTRRIDAGPVTGCMNTTDCQSGYFCNSSGSCDRECAEDRDCEAPAATCAQDGQCISKTDGGCGCDASNSGTSTLLLLLGLALLFWRKVQCRLDERDK